MSQNPVTVDEIMRLVRVCQRQATNYIAARYSDASSAALTSAEFDVRTALTALCADLERVKAVLQEERSLYEHSMRERDELAAELERVQKERDALNIVVKEASDALKREVDFSQRMLFRIDELNGVLFSAQQALLTEGIQRDQAIADRDRLAKERDALCGCAFDPEVEFVLIEECERHREIHTDRDRLAQRCERLQKAINEHWWYATEDGEFGCIHCAKLVEHPEDWNGRDAPVDFPHTETCIVGEGPIVE